MNLGDCNTKPTELEVTIERTRVGANVKIQDLKMRYLVQSIAGFVISALHLFVGVSLHHRNRGVEPAPLTTPPVYHIRPPDFNALFPPPPTYSQSQRHHLLAASAAAAQHHEQPRETQSQTPTLPQNI